MILDLGGKTRREARRMLTRAAHALLESPHTLLTVPKRRRPITARAHAIERQRMRDKVAGTRELANALELALNAMRRDVLHRFGMREARNAIVNDDAARIADGIGQMGFDERHLARAFRAPVATAYRAGRSSAVAELRTFATREAAAPKKAFTVNTAFEDFDPTAAIDALYQTTLVFSRQVVDRERDGLKQLLLNAVKDGDSADEINDAIMLFFEDGIHYIGDDGAVLRTLPQDSWIDMVARTEIARAQNGGISDTYKAAGVELVEFITAEDELVCPECEDLDGTIMDVDSDDVPPIHPSCRCTIIAHDEFSEPSR